MNTTSVRFMQSAIVTSGILTIENIGSGVGVILFNSERKIAAGLHIMAPTSGSINHRNPIMYADTAVPYILSELKKKGAPPPYSIAIAGGASLLGGAKTLNIGNKVVDAIHTALAEAGLAVKLDRTGGSMVRNMVLNVDAGKIKIS